MQDACTVGTLAGSWWIHSLKIRGSEEWPIAKTVRLYPIQYTTQTVMFVIFHCNDCCISPASILVATTDYHAIAHLRSSIMQRQY